jgi:hypothetical protein
MKQIRTVDGIREKKDILFYFTNIDYNQQIHYRYMLKKILAHASIYICL